MDRFGHNTWRAGLDRILLGVAMSGEDHRRIGAALPLDDIASGDIDLAGRLAELADRLGECLAALQRAAGVHEWMRALRVGVRRLGDVAPADTWQVTQFERELARIEESAGGGGTRLGLADVRALFDARLGGRPTRANFRTGTLTVCTMVPMRSVPHRVVCLVGLDDGVVPRAGFVDGDDVLARRPLTGERDVRSEDRQLLLDAIMAATETLVVTYTGADEHTGASVPPAVPLGEILDAVDTVTDASVRDRVLVRHPLQAYDDRNLTPGELGVPSAFSFDRSALAAASVARGGRRPRPVFLDRALPPRPTADVNLDDLKTFLAHPARAFLRGRLDVAAPLEAEELADAIPIDLDGLQKWDIGDRILRDLLAGLEPEATFTAELLRGTLPPGNLGQAALEEVVRRGPRAPPRHVGAAGRHRTQRRRRHRPRRRPTPDRHGVPRLGAPRRLARATPGSAPGSGSPPGSTCSPSARGIRTSTGPVTRSAGRGPAPHVPSRGRSTTGPPSGCATSSRCETKDSACRCPPRSGRPEPGRRRAHRSCAAPTPHPTHAAAREWVTDADNRYGIRGEDDDPAHRQVYGEHAPLRVLLDAGLASAAWRIWEPLLAGAEQGGSAVTDPLPFDITAPAAHRPDDHAARGERRHRQDLDHRRPRHALRRRGPGPARPAAGGDVRPGGQPGAARARARASWSRPSAPWPIR